MSGVDDILLYSHLCNGDQKTGAKSSLSFVDLFNCNLTFVVHFQEFCSL